MTAILKQAITRRLLLASLPASLLVRPAWAEDDTVGAAGDVRGKVVARRTEEVRELATGGGLRLKDSVETEANSFARLDFSGGTTVHLGSSAKLLIDKFVAESGGLLDLGEGALLFDRADELPKIKLTVRSRFGLIAVRGTKFFAGPSKGSFAVFVERGSVRVEAGGVPRRLEAGDGCDIADEGRPPSTKKKWGKARIAEAYASVGL
jgi:ferric-dicitrate binding protein FerR (iron transport regulator)